MPVFLSQEELDRRKDAIEVYRSNLFKTRYLPEVRAFPAVRELFERILANGQQTALASSAKADELATYKKIAGIADLVDEETFLNSLPTRCGSFCTLPLTVRL